MISAIILFVSQFSFSKQYTAEEYYDLKLKAMESVLGTMQDLVGHSIVPFDVGGSVDMYYFSQKKGTAFATMELLREDGIGPKPNKLGTYELVAFTKEPYNSSKKKNAFNAIERRVCWLFSVIANYTRDTVVQPYEMADVPDEDDSMHYMIFDEYPTAEKFNFDGKKHGLMLVIEIFESEKNYADEYGGRALIDLLKKKGYYPYCDLNRKKAI